MAGKCPLQEQRESQQVVMGLAVTVVEALG